MLRYEDLVSNPDAELRQLCHFLRISDDPSLRRPVRGGKPWAGNSMFEDQFSTISAAPVGRWKEALQPEEVAALELVAGPVMRRIGYTLTGQVGALTKPARRRMILRLMALTMEAKSGQVQVIVRAAIDALSNPARSETIDIQPANAPRSRGRFFGEIRNIAKLSILMSKEIFRR